MGSPSAKAAQKPYAEPLEQGLCKLCRDRGVQRDVHLSTIAGGRCVQRLRQGGLPLVMFGLAPGIVGFAVSAALRQVLPLASGAGLRNKRSTRMRQSLRPSKLEREWDVRELRRL